jgi:hypothetical protein
LASLTGSKKRKAYLSRAKIKKPRRELEEEKRACQADIHRFEREKEREMQELKSGFEEKLARHTATASNTRAPPVYPMEGIFGGARPKHPLLEHPSSSGQKGSCPPPYKEDESSGWSNAPLFKEVNIIDSSNWSFDANYKENGPATNPTGTPFSVFRLPKMDLKQFDGDPENWQDFIAIFRDLVHDNNSLTTTQKMAILKLEAFVNTRNSRRTG